MTDARNAPTQALFATRYALGPELGKGSSGRVVRATRQADDHPVAIKFFAGEHSGIPEARTRFLAEAKVAAGIDSPNVVPVLEVGEHEGVPYMVMELLEGRDLEARMRSPSPPGYRALMAILAGVAQGLADLHAAGVVHRDLKPENLLVDAAGVAWILDLGLAKAEDVDQVETQEGILLGTPGYLAPEVLASEPAAAPADIYTLGLVMFRCFVGEEPFPQPDASDRMRAQLRDGAPPGDRLPREVAEIYEEMVRSNPAERPSARTVATRLAALVGRTPAESTGAQAAPPRRSETPGCAGPSAARS